jgi:hypothetical protein
MLNSDDQSGAPEFGAGLSLARRVSSPSATSDGLGWLHYIHIQVPVLTLDPRLTILSGQCVLPP